MIRVAIVEDLACDREKLRDYLCRYQTEKHVSFEIFEFCDGKELLSHYPVNLNLLLMDIQMEHKDGIQTAKRVREFDSNVTLIFITNMIQHALEGYQVDALNFIVKPVEYPVFSAEIRRALGRIKKKSIIVTVKNNNGIYSLNSMAIGYIEAYNHQTVLHTHNRNIPSTQTLTSLEKKLFGLSFIRSHKAFLINMDHIERISGNDVWIFGQQLPISKHRRKEFMEAYAAHLGEIL